MTTSVPAAEAAVDQYRHLAADRLDDLRQGIDRRSAVVAEPSAVIRHDDRIDPGLGREHRILLRQNPLEQELSLHTIAQPVDKDPIHIGAIETLDGGQVEAVEIRPVREKIPEGPTVAVAALAGIGASHPGQGFPIALNDRIYRQNDGRGPGCLRTPDQRFGHLPPVGRVELKPDPGASFGDRVFNRGGGDGRQNLQVVARLRRSRARLRRAQQGAQVRRNRRAYGARSRQSGQTSSVRGVVAGGGAVGLNRLPERGD